VELKVTIRFDWSVFKENLIPRWEWDRRLLFTDLEWNAEYRIQWTGWWLWFDVEWVGGVCRDRTFQEACRCHLCRAR
jgi:hypothetical protein